MSNVSLTLAEFSAKFPVFSAMVTAYPTEVTEVLDEAWRQIQPARYGLRASDAHGYLAAHILTINAPDGSTSITGKDVVSVGAGASRIQYASASASDDDLTTTRWGKMLLRLTKLTGGFTLVNGAGFV